MLGKRLIFYVKPTERCNTKCLHCYNAGAVSPNLDIDAYRRFMDRVAMGIEDRQVEVVLHGGEPTLVGIDNLERIIKETKAALPFSDVQFSIQTNLLHSSLPLFQLVQRYMGGVLGTSYSPGIRFVGTTEYDIWLGNLRMAVAFGVKPYMIITLSKKYIESTKPQSLIDFMIEENIWGFHFEHLTKDGLASDNWLTIKPNSLSYDLWRTEFATLFINSKAYKSIEKSDIVGKAKVFASGSYTGCCTRNCYMSVLTINSDGTVGGCPNKSKQQIFGTVEDELDSILSSPIRREMMVKERMRRPECLECDVFKYCNGGCVQTDECNEGPHFYRLLSEKFLMDNEFKKFVSSSIETPVHV